MFKFHHAVAGLFVAAHSVAQTPVLFTGEAERLPAYPAIELASTPEDINSAEQAFRSEFHNTDQGGVPNLGICATAQWARFPVKYDPSRPPIIQLPYHELDEVNVYWVSPSDTVILAYFGQGVEAASSSNLSRDFACRLPVDQGEGWVYLRIASTKPIQLPVILLSEAGYRSAIDHRNTMGGGYAGIMLVMVLYNIFIFFSTRDRSYLYYVLYVMCIACAQ